MGGQMRYVTADNRDFLLALARGLANDSEPYLCSADRARCKRSCCDHEE